MLWALMVGWALEKQREGHPGGGTQQGRRGGRRGAQGGRVALRGRSELTED